MNTTNCSKLENSISINNKRVSGHINQSTNDVDESSLKLISELQDNLAQFKNKIIKGLTLNDQELNFLLNNMDFFTNQLPSEIKNNFIKLKQNLNNTIKSIDEEYTTILNMDHMDNQQLHTLAINNSELSAIKMISEHVNNTQNYLSQLEENLAIPYAVLSMFVLYSATTILANEADLSQKRIEAFTKLIEDFQAMITLFTNLSGILNGEFSRQKNQAAQDKSQFSPSEDAINWDDASKYHGQGVDHKYIDITSILGGYGWLTWKREDFEKSPLGRFLIKNKYVEFKQGGRFEHDDQLVPGPNLKDGKFDYNDLKAEQKREFDDAMAIDKDENKTDNGQQVKHNYSDGFKYTYSTDIANYYDKNGKPIAGKDIIEDPKYKDAMFLPIDLIPENMRNLPMLKDILEPISTKQDGTITHYSINKTGFMAMFSSVIDSAQQSLGYSEDLNQNLVSGAVGTNKQIDNISKIMQQKIQLVQQKQSALVKVVENAKEDGNRKLDMFNSILKSLTY